jgi:hypothetical protein
MSEMTGELRLDGKVSEYTGRWTLVGETMEWELEGKTYRIESADDLSDSISSFVRVLGKRQLKDKVTLRGCLTCENFSMSGMARDMGRGQRGDCDLHELGVEVCYLCCDYKQKNES